VTTLSVKYAIDRNIPFAEAFKEVGRRYPNCGYAQMYEKWVFSDSVEPYGSWGNGSAMRCFYESDSYESFLRNVFSLSCDCDTLCCIGGGVAEEFYKGTGFDAMKLRCQILYTKNLFALQERKRHVIIRSRKQSL
jgi:ADP-ribosylglycohydrolase